ncbi:MAG TPA: hypothetical protein VF042_06570 [Gemmatimonadaceae bacterium]
MRLYKAFIPFLLVLSACAAEPEIDKPRSQMTQRERDSTIAESGLPGSGVVKKGLSMADGQAKRAAMIDSITDGN